MSYFHDTSLTQRAKASPIGDGRFGAKLAIFENGVKGVLKEQPPTSKMFRGVCQLNMPANEVMAYRLDRDLLHFGVVPETLFITWRGKEASLQKHIEGFQPKEVVPGVFDRKLDDWKQRLQSLADIMPMSELAKVVLFDLIVNNADRHGKNLIVDTHNGNKLWAIDNGTAFGDGYTLYKNVFHKYFFYDELPVDVDTLHALDRLTERDFGDVVRPFKISPKRCSYLYWRTRFVVDHHDRLGFKRISGGRIGNNEFPSYQKWFDKKMYPKDKMAALKVPPRPGVVEDRVDAL